ncbi:MAG TPA: DUF1217 domain-containing protein [Roseomonas sp.]|jgi:hypothetical protein
MSSSLTAAIPLFRQALDPKTEQKALDRLAKDPNINRQLAAYKTAVTQAKDLDSALKDPRVLAVLLPAMGLGDQVQNVALAQKALTSDLSDPKSLANQLTDTRWKDTATALDLTKKGLAALQDPALIDKLSSGLRDLSWRNSLDDTAPGISDALYFQDNAKNAKGPYDILGNAVLRRVVTGALGLPQEFALQPVETQAKVIQNRIDIKDLQDPKKVQKLAEQYLVMNNINSTASTPSLAVLLGSGSSGQGFTGIDLSAISGINLLL